MSKFDDVVRNLIVPDAVRAAGPIAELVWMLEQGGCTVDSRHGKLSTRRLERSSSKPRRRRRRTS